ncbi:TetR/AcrR family transcriptional regulator [Curtobacterium sp. MCPF17_031]|uniref:TetR/AcrR family transcriptional regulator n=1 Tax=Curtobacterium sp. MCPF17_031 TaxID=2175653 RepID=UPI000DA9E793|nr:TetR/AcrR family transcriptional regulator [Curtobacterium sp. MCPF17_031]PZE37125.1 TetR/AcrR family transcriptional regulator [Curtobacterium sp. MCPF17_031]
MTTAPPREKRTQTRLAPEVRRRQIVTEATRLISVAGFNAVSLTDVADACGIRGPSVLHHFPSMNDLLAAVLAYRDEVDSTDPPASNAISTPESVKVFLRGRVLRNLERGQLVRLYVVLGAEAVDPAHPAHQYFVRREQSTYEGFERLVRWKTHPDLAARELLAFWTGLERQWVMDPSVDFLAVWDNFADRFFVAS